MIYECKESIILAPKNTLKFIKKNEGYKPRVYKCTAGVDTIGIGFAIKDLYLSEDVCEIILAQILSERELQLKQKCDWYATLPEEAKMVVLDLVYNLGISGFFKFRKTIALLEKHDFEGASEELLDSKYAKIDVPNRAKRNSQILFNIKTEE